MRHGKAGRKFGRTSDQRLALTKSQMTSLLRYGRITTTEAKAKELRRWAERLITAAKPDNVAARRAVARHITDREAANRLFQTYLPRLKDRPGGYTRVLLLPPRHGDNAPMAIVELVDRVEA